MKKIISLSIFLEKLPVVDRIVSVEEHDSVVPSSNKVLFENYYYILAEISCVVFEQMNVGVPFAKLSSF